MKNLQTLWNGVDCPCPIQNMSLVALHTMCDCGNITSKDKTCLAMKNKV